MLRDKGFVLCEGVKYEFMKIVIVYNCLLSELRVFLYLFEKF